MEFSSANFKSELQCSCLNSLGNKRCFPNCFLRFSREHYIFLEGLERCRLVSYSSPQRGPPLSSAKSNDDLAYYVQKEEQPRFSSLFVTILLHILQKLTTMYVPIIRANLLQLNMPGKRRWSKSWKLKTTTVSELILEWDRRGEARRAESGGWGCWGGDSQPLPNN